MNTELILTLCAILALGVMWYTERTRRQKAELAGNVDAVREVLDAIQKKLDEQKAEYDRTAADLARARIPDYMLDKLGRPSPFDRAPPAGAVESITGRTFRPGIDGPDTGGGAA